MMMMIIQGIRIKYFSIIKNFENFEKEFFLENCFQKVFSGINLADFEKEFFLEAGFQICRDPRNHTPRKILIRKIYQESTWRHGEPWICSKIHAKNVKIRGALRAPLFLEEILKTMLGEKFFRESDFQIREKVRNHTPRKILSGEEFSEINSANFEKKSFFKNA